MYDTRLQLWQESVEGKAEAKAGVLKAEEAAIELQDRSAADAFHDHTFSHPAAYRQPDVCKGYMARSGTDSPMKHRWSAEEESRSRHHHPQSSRGKFNSDSRERSSRSWRADPEQTSSNRIEDEIDSYRPLKRREHSRESYRSYGRRSSISPKRSSQAIYLSRNRFDDTKSYRSRNISASRSPKRRRTRSPSPVRNGRLRSEQRGRSRSWSRSPARGDSWDRRPAIDRAYSPRRLSPVRYSGAISRGIEPEIDSYVPSHRRRTPTPPYRRDRKSPSPRRRSRTSPRRHKNEPLSPKPRDLSPYSSHPVGGDHVVRSSGKEAKFASKSFVTDDNSHNHMDAPNSTRGNHGVHNDMTHGRSRPYQDRQYHGSPPTSTPNSSYQGSPQSNASYHANRGGWVGSQQYHGHHGQTSNTSPPYRQNSYSGGDQNQYFRNQQQYNNHPQGYHQPPYRGRGGHFSRGDRSFSGPQDHRGGHRGRGGHYNNLQWNAKRGGAQSGNFATGANSIQTSPASSHQTSKEPFGSAAEEETSLRPSKELQHEDQRIKGSYHNHQSGNQSKDSKFSFAFKTKASSVAPAKAPTDLTAKARGPQRSIEPINSRAPPTQPKGKPFDKRDERTNERPDRFDRKHELRNEKKHPPNRPANQRPRSRSPPAKKQKQEPKQRPTLSPEMAASESIYYRKPGNESVVGAGTYGKVFKAIHIYTKDKVALKKIRMEGERDGFPITAVREIRLLQHLRHRHVVALQEVMVERNECFMVFEYLSHDLTGLINHPSFKLTSAHKKDLARQMFDGLSYLHKRGVLHRDIKAANILISNTGQLKYADFGLARFYNKSRTLDYTNRVITIWYRPPELLLGETQYGPAVDVWSAACVFVEMFTKKAVFPGEGGELSQLDKVYNILGTPTRNEWPGLVDLPWFELMQPSERRKRQFEMLFTNVLSPAALDLVRSMFRYDPGKRPSADEVLQHAYFVEEEPTAAQAFELEEVEGDWHEFESKAHRRENDKRKKEEYMREREKRKAKEAGVEQGAEIDTKKARPRDEKSTRHISSNSKTEVDSKDYTKAHTHESEGDSEGEGSARMSMS